MCPKSKTVSSPTENVSETTKRPFVTEKEITRDPIFTWCDKPFGIDQHIVHIAWFIPAHLFAAYVSYLGIFTKQIPVTSLIFEILYGYLGGLGITVGCHRLWTHKTFKANMPLQTILMFMQTIAFQYPIHKWCLDHRIHHKYVDTDADPHNSTRGFWFSHIGWLVLPKHKDFEEKLKTFDMSDLESNPVVRFQSRWYIPLLILLHFLIPISVLHFVWKMPLLYCFGVNCRRYLLHLHLAFCVNSFAHLWGDKPYEKNISSVENRAVSLFALGEGWHNYHHTFPWDYRASEFGWKINVSSMFIDFFASIGWAWDMKTVSHEMLQNRIRRTGDGSHPDAIINPPKQNDKKDGIMEYLKGGDHPTFWGWGDDKIPDEFRKVTQILRRK